MQFGVYLNTQARGSASLNQVYNELLETAEVAESVGFDWCFLPEHHQQPDGYLPSPFVMAGAIAARTERLGIATGINILPLWHPLRVAEDAAVVDNLSNGRFMLGVGLGLVEDEFRQFGIDLRTAVSRFEEQVQLIRMAWSDDAVTFAGRHFALDGIDVTPKPVQRPGPRILIGGMSDTAVARAGTHGDGWLTDPLHSMTTLARWAQLYRAAAATANTPPAIWLQRDCWVADSEEEVESEWAPWLVEDWRFYFGLGLFSSGRFNPAAERWISEVRSPTDITFDKLRADRIVAGPPELVADILRGMNDLIGPVGVCFRFRFPDGPPHEATINAIRRFGNEVIPALRTATPPAASTLR